MHLYVYGGQSPGDEHEYSEVTAIINQKILDVVRLKT